jgi:hypothetical protein
MCLCHVMYRKMSQQQKYDFQLVTYELAQINHKNVGLGAIVLTI